MKRISIALAATVTLCAGCRIKQPYSVPVAPVPAAYQNAPANFQNATPATTEAAKDWKQATPADAQDKSKWWEVYGDAQLNALEERVEVDNQSLKAAVARYAEAHALVLETRSQQKPTMAAGGDVARDRISRNKGNPPTESNADYNDFTVGLSASWEPDLWGRIRTLVGASVQQAQASAADLENVRLSLHAELAADYFALRSAENEAKVLHDSVQAYAKALQMMQDRYDGGLASRVDVEQARTQLEAASAQEADLSESRTHAANAIAVLTGELPENFKLAAEAHAMTPPEIPTGVPSELLERRPDIAAEERRVALANSQIGLARAAYYPQVILSGALGLESKSLGRWMSSPSRYWAVGPLLSETLFDAGRRRAGVAQAAAGYDESVANYREQVLTAFQQVEDNLASLRILAEESARQQRAVASALRAEQLAMHRYQGGLVTYLDVISTQNLRLQNERIAVGIERRRMQASVALIRALGGGWRSSSLPRAFLLTAGK
jgi:NodT family efflux transporter outer membrane factor (OMF) lipoprotein